MSTDVIGFSLPRKEAWGKVDGEALYIGDLKISRCLEGKVLRSPLAHARIVNIDTSKARKLPGVLAVITGNDLPDRLFGVAVSDQPILAKERVRFVGERVVAVAAIDADTAQQAINLIEVDYAELPFVVDPLDAIRTDSPVLHSGMKKGEFPLGPASINVLHHETYGIGNLNKGFAQADCVYEHTFRTPIQHQGYIEPHGCIVQIESDGNVRVWSNNKAPFELRGSLAALLDLPSEQIEIIYGNIGGEFGGKGSVMDEPVCYYLSLASGRPVRIMMTSAEELIAGYPRHESVITLKSGVLKDGTLVARQATVIFNAGAYASANANPTPFGLRRALGVYRIPHSRIDGYAVYTNSVPTGHCRAPGDPQVFFAVESHTDMIAEAIGLNPLEFRKLNALRPGNTSPSGLKWEGINAIEVLDMAVRNSSWGQPRRSSTSGVGMALTERTTGKGGSAAIVMVHADGSATVVSGLTDPGTGSRTIMRQIVASELQIPHANVGFGGGTTVLAPYDNGSGSSRVTNVTGHAVQLAARDALEQLKSMAAAQLESEVGNINLETGIFRTSKGNQRSLREVLNKAGKAKNVVIGRGSFVAESSKTTCFAAQVAEVDVDIETGHVSVRRIVAVNDIGRAINPLAVKGQVEGAVVQGMGFALYEELPYLNGRPLVQHLSDYKLTTAQDIPHVESYLLEGWLGPGPYGAKSIGEQVNAAVAPAIANAIYDAVGVRVTELPITPEKLLAAMRKKQWNGGQQE